MAGADRPPPEHLIERLRETPYAFDFYQAVRRLECAHPDKPRVGQSRHAADDAIRFGQEPSVAFAPAPIAGFVPGGNGDAGALRIHFMGLLGPNGPMPLHFTEYVRDRLRNSHDATLARFLDLFHHRMISLFYRVWSTHHQAVSRDRPDSDRFADYVSSLIGTGFPSLRGRDSVPDDARRYFAGHLSSVRRNADGLRSILQDDFGVPVEIDQLVGQWIDLPPEYQCRMGESPETGALGKTLVIGSRMWDCQQKFRVIFGPLGLEDFERFLPITSSFRRVVDWVRSYAGPHLCWDLQLILKKSEVPPLQLGRSARLGWTTWLTTTPPEGDADSLILQPDAA